MWKENYAIGNNIKNQIQRTKGNQITSGCLFSYKKGGFINEFSDM